MSTKSIRGSRVVRFGPYELDVRAGELRKGDEKVRLQEQPYRILTMLLERPGEVVLREEICKRLWPNGTVVEVSHGINAAVLRLREALGDSAESPRFVETVARRGYRFLAPVEVDCRRTPSGGETPLAGHREEFAAGQAISHFRLDEKLGRGGMGVVYRAQDIHLNRPVALKFVAPEMAGDPMAVSRFQREARTASALNHPNICTVYAVEECDGHPAIVMELLEGRTLEAILAEGALPAERALPLAIQMAAALDAAHRKGIVHRDLKPGNVMVTQFGVKVLDFGLAKQSTGGAASDGLTRSGSLMGTPNYMAPELFRGQEANPRSDLYSFGLVLREMLTGRAPGFESGGVLPAAAADLAPLVQRALESNPQDRWQTAGDLKAALECAAAARSSHVPVAPREMRARGWMDRRTIAAAVTVLAMVPAAWYGASAVAARKDGAPILPATVPEPPLTQPAVDRAGVLHGEAVPYRLPATRPAVNGRFRLSPDGRRLAYPAAGEIYVRTLDGSDTRLIASNAGMSGTPFWSPDGRSVAFTNGGHLYTVSAVGGMTKMIGDINTNIEGAWGPDGTILIGEVRGGLIAFPSSGGAPRRVTKPDEQRGETRHLLPAFLPGGRKFIYTAGSEKVSGGMLYAGSLDSGARVPLIPIESGASFVPQNGPKGYLVFVRSGSLMIQPFNAALLKTEGEARRMGGPVAGTTAAAAAITIGDFSATPATLAYRSASGLRGMISLASMTAQPSDLVVMENWMSQLR